MIVKKRLFARLSNSLESRKMNTAIYLIFLEYLLKCIVIEKVYLIEFKILASYLLYSVICISPITPSMLPTFT